MYFWPRRLFSAARGLAAVWWGLLFIAVAQASHCGGFFHCRAQAVGRRGFRSCGVLVYLLRGTWAPPEAGMGAVSLAVAGGVLTTRP